MASATITIEGFAAADSALKFTPSGAPVLEVSIPVTPQRKGDDGKWVDLPDAMTAWYRCALWGPLAETTSIPKGSMVQVVGTLKPRTWQDRDGKDQVSLDVTVRSIGILREPRGTSSGGYQRPTTEQTSQGDPWGAPDDSQPPF